VDKPTRNAIEKATQKARRLLEADFATQLEGDYNVLSSGEIAAQGGPHLTPLQRLQRSKIVAAIEHKQGLGMKPKDAIADYLRDAAFTALNRYVALKMLEARDLVQDCITHGEQSSGYKEFYGLAPGVALLPDGAGYRLYIESIFDELSTEIKVLFDRRDPASILWPRRPTFEELLSILNVPELGGVWGEDETIGWVYQFFNSGDERRKMRDESAAPRNSRELAIRNQFFTPSYVVQFLVDNTLGRMWYEMRQGKTGLKEKCEYMVRRSDEVIPARAQKDPRDMRVLDPACGSGHFLLYAFELLIPIYAEGWSDGPISEVTGKTLKEDYPDLEVMRRDLPGMILGYNLHGVDIDPRCAQIAQLALWMRAQKAFKQMGMARGHRPAVVRTHIVVAEPMPGQADLVKAFAATLDPPLIGELFKKIVAETALAGELGVLLRLEQALSAAVEKAREGFKTLQKQGGQQSFFPDLAPVKPQVELDLSGIDDVSFFEVAEDRILVALKHFADSASGQAGMRRRLFAGDSAQGLALLELCQKRFTVVLMNPPFGTCCAGSKLDFEKAYPKTKNDVYAAFVERGIELLNPKCRLGAITSRTGFFLSSFQKWREDVLLKKSPPVVFADLGSGVLDSAMVETAAYCLESLI
jgi:hypothetical protein